MRRGLVWSLILIIVAAAGSLAATIAVGNAPLLGLDLKGGVSLVLQPQGTANASQLQEAVNIIDRRVNGLGVSNSSVNRQGNDVVISLPGIKNSQQALTELGQTAVLYFRPVLCEIAPYSPPSTSSSSTTTTVPGSPPTTSPHVTPTTAPPATKAAHSARPVQAVLDDVRLPATGSSTTTATTAPATTVPAATTVPPTTIISNPSGQGQGTIVPPSAPVSQSTCQAANSSQIPSTPITQDTAKASVILPYKFSNQYRYVLGPADLTGSAVSNASVQVDPTTGQYSVVLNLTNKGATAFDNFAAARYACYQQNTSNPPPCSMEAFELDGVVESAPDFQAASFHGTAVISGSFTSAQASDLANVLKYGSLPVRFVPQSVQTVSATIGRDSLKAGLLAGIGGLAVVMLYMLVYYRALGLVVLTGLCVGGSILYSIITELSHTSYHLTLTLAGVTGIIVSIGITVDSYVVYFERLKDEVRAGRTVRQSVERGFTRAFRTVLTADLVSLLAAVILYFFSIGDVKGFAFTLGLSTVLDIFTAYFFIRPAVIIVGRRRAFTDNPVFGIARGLGARTTTRQA